MDLFGSYAGTDYGQGRGLAFQRLPVYLLLGLNCNFANTEHPIESELETIKISHPTQTEEDRFSAFKLSH